MHRMIAMAALVGGLTAALGCHHIGGKSDCGYNPADYPIGPPTPPYPSIPAPPPPEKVPDKIPGSIFKSSAETGAADPTGLDKLPTVPGSGY